MACLGRLYPVKSFIGCLPKVLPRSFLNTLTHLKYPLVRFWIIISEFIITKHLHMT